MAWVAWEALNFGVQALGTWRAEELHRRALAQDTSLHGRSIAAATEQHFQAISAELLSDAKEADRDVWEQRNGQFNNLLVCGTLMFGIAMSTIIEGSFSSQATSGLAATAFTTSVALALLSLFVCLILAN